MHVEVDVSFGLPSFTMVGLPDASVRESRDRVRSAIRNSGFEFPPHRITVNLAPADVRKAGAAFDLPIALGILAASGVLERREIPDLVLLGELSLDGSIQPTRGVLPIAAAARREGVPGVLVHGLNTRPGKPTILGVCDGKAVIGLPGNPVSALVNGYLFVVPVIEKLLGLPADKPRPSLIARLTVNIASQAGREDWIPVKLVKRKSEIENWDAEPIFGKSNLIFTLAAADGLVQIHPDATGFRTVRQAPCT